MRKLVSIVLSVITVILALFIFEVLFNQTGLTIGVLKLFPTLIQTLNISKHLVKAIICIVFSFVLFGTVWVNKKQENKLWLLISLIFEIAGLFALIKHVGGVN